MAMNAAVTGTSGPVIPVEFPQPRPGPATGSHTALNDRAAAANGAPAPAPAPVANKTGTDKTGTDKTGAVTVNPTFRTRYSEDAPKITPRITPIRRARMDSSGMCAEAGM